MQVTVIGADRPLGAALTAGLGADFAVAGLGAKSAHGCRQADLLERPALEDALRGAEGIVLATAFDPEASSEQALLDSAARGAYVALTAAVAVGARRLVLLSRLDLVRDYPEHYAVGEQWNAVPRAEAGSLAPLMAELTGREIARTGRIEVCCLRLGEIGTEASTEDVLAAVRTALTEERAGHHWWIRHVASSGRFAKGA